MNYILDILGYLTIWHLFKSIWLHKDAWEISEISELLVAIDICHLIIK